MAIEELSHFLIVMLDWIEASLSLTLKLFVVIVVPEFAESLHNPP